MTAAPPPRQHLPVRPIWLCRVCGAPWPCGPARLALLAEYGVNRVALSIYMAAMLHEAARDLFKLNPDGQQDLGELFRRFIEWPHRRAVGPSSS